VKVVPKTSLKRSGIENRASDKSPIFLSGNRVLLGELPIPKRPMFEDNRCKRIMIVAHCILNQNSMSDASAYRLEALLKKSI